MESFLRRIHHIWQPHQGQREFLVNQAKTKVLACGRRWGKTEVCAIGVTAVLAGSAPTQHLLVAPTLDQARLLFERVVEFVEKIREGCGDLLRDAVAKIKLTPYPRLDLGIHRVVARSGHVGRSLRGNEATHVIVDEAAYVPEELITEVLTPMLATNDGNLTLISTPNGTNHFWRYWSMGMRGELGFWARTAPSSESPHVSPSFLEVQRQLISERAFRVEYEAQFADSANRVFKTEAIQACLVPSVSAPAHAPVFIGIDWARYQDFTAVAVVAGYRDDAVLLECRRINSAPWAVQVRQVAAIVESYPGAAILCDSTGSGDPVREMLQERLANRYIDGFTFNSNNKYGLIDSLAVLVDNGKLKMEPNPELIREMQHFETKMSRGGATRMEASGGYHDDLVIALALAASKLPKAGGLGVRIARRVWG